MDPSHYLHNTKLPTHTLYIQYKGVFDLQDVYQTVVDFFMHKKFKLNEKMHRHRRPTAFGAEQQQAFEAVRNIGDYYRWIVNINIESFDLKEVDVVLKDGTKRKMNKGRLWIQLYGVCETDYEKTWEKSAFLAHLKSFYNKYIVRKRAEGVWWDQLYYKIVLRLHALIKERLKMDSEGYETRHHGGVH